MIAANVRIVNSQLGARFFWRARVLFTCAVTTGRLHCRERACISNVVRTKRIRALVKTRDGAVRSQAKPLGVIRQHRQNAHNDASILVVLFTLMSGSNAASARLARLTPLRPLDRAFRVREFIREALQGGDKGPEMLR